MNGNKSARGSRAVGPGALRWIVTVATIAFVLGGCEQGTSSAASSPPESTKVQFSTTVEKPQSGLEQPQSEPAQSKESNARPTEENQEGTATIADLPGESTLAVIESIVDGDTVRTNLGLVRLIGIDTPERGECAFDDAYELMEELVAPGTTVILVLPEGQNDQDKYDRLLRYVIREDGVDVGLEQLEAGYAVARYDSRDGYPKHPKENDYHTAQTATLTEQKRVEAVGCEGTSYLPNPGGTAGEEEWWTQYSSCKKLKQNTNGHPTGPFDRDDPAEVDIYNWFQYGTGHRGDGDGDGLACE